MPTLIKTSLKNSTKALQAELEFRREAIQFVGNVVMAREFCQKHHKGRNVSTEIRLPVVTQYFLYRNKWTTMGIARFIIRYQNNLLDMITGGEHQYAKLVDLISKAKIITNKQLEYENQTI